MEDKVAEFRVNSIVQLLGTNKTGRILDWATQRPIYHRQLGSTHFAIRPIDADDNESEPVVYWPHSQVRSIEPSADQEEDFKFRF